MEEVVGSIPTRSTIFSTHYKRAPGLRRWKLLVAPPPLRFAAQGLRSAPAALGNARRVVCRSQDARRAGKALRSRDSRWLTSCSRTVGAWVWHFTLGKDSRWHESPSPKEELTHEYRH